MKYHALGNPRIAWQPVISRALADLSCDIHFAKVETTQGLASSVFYASEIGGGQVLDPEKAHNLRLLLKAVAEEFQAARR